MMSGFEVEWCENVPTFPDGSSDIDAIDWLRRDFSKQDEAVAFAKDRLPFDGFGSVRVTPFEMEEIEPGACAYHREYTGDSEHIEE